MRLELTGQPGGFLAGLPGFLPGLVAFALGSGEPFGHAVRLGGCRLLLFLVRFALGVGLGANARQFLAYLVELGSSGRRGLLLFGQCSACLLGVLVRPVQLRAQLAGAALDLLGAGLGGVRLFLGGGQAGPQLVGFAACGRFGGLDGRQAGLQLLHVAGQLVGKLGRLGPVGLQLGAGLLQRLTLHGQAGVR